MAHFEKTVDRAMKNGQGTVGIAMDFNFNPDIMAAVLIRRNLQRHAFKADTIIGTDRSFMLLAKDILQMRSGPGNKSRAFFQRFVCKFFVVCRQINFHDVMVGFSHR